jgi:iron-sulfur cluster assembly protein
MIIVTERAAAKAKSLAEREGVVPMLRLGVKGGGCSGLSYFYAFDDQERPGDTVWDVGGVTLRVDPKSLNLLDGCQLDYDTHILKSGFRFSNPKAKASCSCGESFTL